MIGFAETFKDIPGWEGYYQVSNAGRVKSLARVVMNPRYGEQRLKERIVKPAKNSDGYLHVGLHRDGKRITVDVHSLVIRTFLGDHVDLEVNHLDGNKTNNFLMNLQFVTRKENMEHAFETNLMRRTQRRPVKCSNGIVYPSITSAARSLGLNSGHIHKVLKKKLSHAKGYKFEAVNARS